MERKDFLKGSLGLIGISSVINACTKESPENQLSTSASSIDKATGCVVTPEETQGPYPYPSGEINNPLQRSDIRENQTGILINYTFLVVNTNSCAVVPNARVDIWHCNKDGNYSGYKNFTGQTWLRGYQIANAQGQVKFTSIYPGWYPGRATHIHIEIFVNNTLRKIAQLAFPENVSNHVHRSRLYAAHGINPTHTLDDNIFRKPAGDLANETINIVQFTQPPITANFTFGIVL